MTIPQKYLQAARRLRLEELISSVYANDTVKTAWTPFALAKEMIDKLPSLTGKILVLSDLGFIPMLVKAGVKSEDITFVAHTKEQENLATQMSLGGLLQVGYNEPIKELEKQLGDMKFDIVIGNPPYQRPDESSKKLWLPFYFVAFASLSIGGTVAFLTPSSFLLRSGATMKKLRAEFTMRDVVFLDFDATNYFNVGESIVMAIVTDKKTNILTEVKSEGVITEQNLTNEIFPYLSSNHQLEQSIMKKLITSNEPRLPQREDINNSQKKMVDAGILSLTKDDVYIYPVIYTPNSTHYAKELFGDGDKLKLMITVAGTYYSEKTPNRNIFVTTAHSGQGMFHILIPSVEAGESIKKYLISKLYRFFIAAEKTSGYNTGIAKLPFLDYTRKWSDEELYNHFSLTNEEIALIEASVK